MLRCLQGDAFRVMDGAQHLLHEFERKASLHAAGIAVCPAESCSSKACQGAPFCSTCTGWRRTKAEARSICNFAESLKSALTVEDHQVQRRL